MALSAILRKEAQERYDVPRLWNNPGQKYNAAQGRVHVWACTNATERLHHLLSGLGPQEWDLPCYHPNRIRPVRSFVDLWLRELAMHGLDIRSRLEPSAHLSAESLPIFMETMARTLRGGPDAMLSVIWLAR